MRDNKRIKAVIFDLDDTLIDWSGKSKGWREFLDPKLANVHRYLVAQGHRPPPPEELGEIIHEKTSFIWARAVETWEGARLVDALDLAFTEVGLPVSEIDIEAVIRAYDWEPFPGVAPFPDAHQVLDALQTDGYKLGLITNAYQPMWVRDVELEAYGLIDYFEARITSGDTGYIKPHPQIYNIMLDILDLEAKDSIYIGDRPGNDILGAHNANMLSVLMAPPHHEPRDLEGTEPDFTIESLSGLLPILKDLD